MRNKTVQPTKHDYFEPDSYCMDLRVLPYVVMIIMITLFFSGCQKYEAMPLDQAAVQKALAVPSEQALAVKAQTLKHPTIPPITLHFKDGLSPEEAAVIAVLNNPSLKVIRDHNGVAAGELMQAGLLPNPQLGLVNERVIGGNTADTVSAYSYGLNWDVTELLSHSAEVSAAEKNRDSVYLDVGWQEWQIAEGAKAAVYNLFSVQSQLVLAKQSDRNLRENLSVVQKAIQEGLVTEMDLSAAQTASHQAHATVLDLQQQVLEQRVALNRMLGFDVDTSVAVQQDIALPSSLNVPAVKDLLSDLEKRRLDLVALHLGYESQEESLRAAVMNQFPRVNIGLFKARDTGNVVTSGLELSIDLPVFDRNQGQIAIERATRKQLFDEYVDRISETRADVAKLSAAIPIIIDQIHTAEAAAASGQKLVETYRIATEKGQADVLSYYNAWSDLNNRQIEIIKLKQQLVDTRIALELATGSYNLDEMQTPDDTITNEVTK